MGDIDYRLLGALAAQLRERARVTQPHVSTRRILAACFPCVVVTGAPLPGGILGLTRVSAERTTIFYKRSLEPPAQRIVIAHEIGHLVTDLRALREQGRCIERQCITAGHGRRTDFERVDATEIGCDFFAEELLAPLARLDLEVPDVVPRTLPARIAWANAIDTLASKYHLPKAVMRSRVEHLQLARGGDQALAPLLGAQGARRRRAG